MTYEQARKDHEYLWAIAPAADMTGGYEDQRDLHRLMKSPYRATATSVYCDQILYIGSRRGRRRAGAVAAQYPGMTPSSRR